MTFRIPSPGDIGAREFDGHPESYDAVNKNIPKGWIWFGSLIFDARSDAASCMNMYISHVPECDRGGCALMSEAPEMKVIKRGGSTDPHYLIVLLPPAGTSQ